MFSLNWFYRELARPELIKRKLAFMNSFTFL